MSYPLSHKSVVILDKSNYYLQTNCEQSFEFDVINKSRQPSGIIPLSPISKSLWTCSVEAIAEYCRIVWDIFPNGERLIRFVVCGTDSADSVNDWNCEQHNLESCMESLAKFSSIAHLKSKQFKNYEKCQIIDGFNKAIEALSEPTLLQTINKNNGLLNRGRIISISSFRNDSHIRSVEESVREMLYERNKLIANQKQTDINCNLMQIDFCELVFINTYPIEDQTSTSKIIEIPKHDLSPFISSEVHSVKSGRFLAAKLSYLVLSHYDLASTTVTGIPMKEEQNASSSANYDVEIVHPSIAHTDLFKSGSFGAEGVCVKAFREGFSYDTITLKWCTPRTNAVELHYCTTAHRITSVDVNSRPSSCLTNFLLSGRTVMLEMPRLKGSKVMSHMLSSHNSELYIHTLGTGRSTLEDPPSISEGSGGRVTDYRINDFGEMMKKNRLVPCRLIQTANKDTLFPIEKAKQSLTKQTLYWPLVIGHTILYNIQQHIQSFLNLVPKEYLTEEEVLECKKAIYHLVGMESKGTNLPVPTIGIRGKGPKREELYRMMWNEIEYFLRSYCVTPEHNSILSCLLECRSKPDTHSNSSSVRTSDTPEELSNKKQTNSNSSSKGNESEWTQSWAWKELNQWTKNELNQMSDKETNGNTTISLTPEPPQKKFKTNSIESVSNKVTTSGPQSLLNIWTHKLIEDNSKKRFEFIGRTTAEGNIAKLYVNVNDKNETQ